ncbi:MAG: GHMP kinase [Flavobacteriales bacterium]|nr:GHMP kinase [Flavobacteriales bacterium]
MQPFYTTSHTKLLLTAEYLVLDGARALALPLKFNQSLQVLPSVSTLREIKWISKELGEIWFTAEFRLDDFTIISASQNDIAETLKNIFKAVRRINPHFLLDSTSCELTTDTDFRLCWGLGSSSTLIANIAKWADVDPFYLQKEIFGGSGYDIACAIASSPIFYALENGKPHVLQAAFDPPFKDKIGFVYSGHKMNSRSSMKHYQEKKKDLDVWIGKVSTITENLIDVKDIETFESLLFEHEQILSQILVTPTIASQCFKDYPYLIKSLGAWGGDFLLFTCRDMSEAITYFNKKGYATIFRYADIVL